jgi:hypothetical protein
MHTLQPTASLIAGSSMPRRHTLKRMMSSSTILLLTVIGTLIIVLALLILFHHNLNATKGYRLRTLEHARGQLMLEQEYLNMQIANAQSLETLEKDPQVLSMLKAKNQKYIEAESIGTSGIALLKNDATVTE